MISKIISTQSILATAVAAASLGSCWVHAVEQDANAKQEQHSTIEEVIVTIARIEQPLEDVVGSVSQFDTQDILTIQPYDLNDMFELQSGVDVLRTGSRGSLTSLQIRGSSSEQTLMLVNGVRIASATSGSSTYQLVPPELIGNVEVLRGSASALYGSDAIGGVVNIVTKASELNSKKVDLGIDYGSHDYHRTSVAGSYGGNTVGVGAAVVREASAGIDSRIHEDAADPDADDDGYERLGGGINLNYQPDELTQIMFLGFSNSNESDYDNGAGTDSGPYQDSSLSVYQLAGKRRVNAVYQTTIAVGRAADESQHKARNPAPWDTVSHFNTTNITLSWLNQFDFADQSLVLGYEQLDAEVDSSDAYINQAGEVVDSRSTDALFAQLVGGVSRFSYAAGVRRDDIDGVGAENSVNLGGALIIADGHKVHARFAEGFIAPTFNSAYYPEVAYEWPVGTQNVYRGNPDLIPEQSDSYEIGYEANFSQFAIGGAIYRKDVDNLIETAYRVLDDGTNFSTPENINQAEIQGVELVAALSLEQFGVFNAAFDFLDAVDTSGEKDQPLNYRAKRTLRLTWQKTIAAVEMGLQAKLQSQRKVPESIVAEGYTPGYGIVNATVAYPLSEHVRIQAKLNNVLNKEYTLNPSYNEDGRNWVVGVKASF